MTGEPSTETPRSDRRRHLLLLLLLLLALLALTGISVGWKAGAFGSSSHKPSETKGSAGAHKTIDRTPPANPMITSHPTNPTNQIAASFSFTDSSPDVAGYLCRLDSSAYAACSSSKSYSKLSQGSHTFAVEASDAAGNTSTDSSFSWVVDTTAPPDPTIVDHPTDRSRSSAATLAFSDAEAAVSFECSLEGGEWMSCDSPQTYAGLVTGDHAFAVRALDAAGNQSGETAFDWQIVSNPAPSKVSGDGNDVAQVSGVGFKITGGVAGLTPERATAVRLKLTNPNGVPIFVTALTVTIAADSTPAGCSSANNVQLTQSNASSDDPITVPARGSVTLTSAPRAPKIMLLNLPGVNQDVCKNKNFALTYSGSARS